MRQNRLLFAKSQRAFTLIELLVTMTMLGILMAIALPNLRDFVVGNRLSSNVNAFIGVLNYARSEAIIRNKQVIVCPKNNTTNACVTDTEWGKYDIQIFVDNNGNDVFNGPSAGVEGDEVIKTIAATDTSGAQFAFRRQGAGANEVKFQSGGFGTNLYRFDINVINTADTAYEIKYGRTICISRPGRTRVLGLVNVCPPN